MTVIDLRRPLSSSRPADHDERPGVAAPYRRGTGKPHSIVRMVLGLVFVIVVLWDGFLPQQLGGRMSFVITDGISMLPHFHAGDLVIVRKEPSYHVGEVAAYHNRELKVIVLHRIIAIDGKHYVFKGDNNGFVTTYEPTKAQIVGADWIHVPGGGHILLDLRIPIVAAVLLGLLWLFSFWPRARTRRQRRRHRHAS